MRLLPDGFSPAARLVALMIGSRSMLLMIAVMSSGLSHSHSTSSYGPRNMLPARVKPNRQKNPGRA